MTGQVPPLDDLQKVKWIVLCASHELNNIGDLSSATIEDLLVVEVQVELILPIIECIELPDPVASEVLDRIRLGEKLQGSDERLRVWKELFDFLSRELSKD